MSELITDLTYSSGIERGQIPVQRQLVDLPTRARKVIMDRVTEGDPEGRFQLKVRDGLPDTWLDSDKIDQILSELVANAVLHGAGIVTIVVEPAYFDSDQAASVPTHSPPNAVAVSVRDEGRGIAPEEIPKVFHQFWRSRRRSGTGLGLYIVKGLVEAHGGRIGVHSTLGEGAEFRFIVPVSTTMAAPRSLDASPT